MIHVAGGLKGLVMKWTWGEEEMTIMFSAGSSCD